MQMKESHHQSNTEADYKPDLNRNDIFDYKEKLNLET